MTAHGTPMPLDSSEAKVSEHREPDANCWSWDPRRGKGSWLERGSRIVAFSDCGRFEDHEPQPLSSRDPLPLLRIHIRFLEARSGVCTPRAPAQQRPPIPVREPFFFEQCSTTPATVAATPPCSATPFQTQISVRHLRGQRGGEVQGCRNGRFGKRSFCPLPKTGGFDENWRKF